MHAVVKKLDLDLTCPDLTNEINEAIVEISNSGGGVLEIPSGIHETGTIFLKSGVTLHLPEGAVLQGSENPEAYAALYMNPLPGRPHWTYPATACALVIAEGQENVAIVGKGEIRGIGNSPYHGGETAQTEFRPHLVVFKDCQGVAVRGVSLNYSSFWTLHMLRCRDVDIEGVDIRTHLNRINADGIDPDGCENVRITNCRVHSADDPLTIKSTEGDASRNIVVRHCEFMSTFGGIKIGTESMGEFSDIKISGCRVLGSWVGICLYMKDGGSYRNITYEDMDVVSKAPFSIIIDNTPRFHGVTRAGEIEEVTIRDIRISGPGRLIVEGLPGHPVKGLRLQDITFRRSGNIDFANTKKPNGSGLVELDPDREIHATQPYFFLGIRMEDFIWENLQVLHEEGLPASGAGILYLNHCREGEVSLSGDLETGSGGCLLKDSRDVRVEIAGIEQPCN